MKWTLLLALSVAATGVTLVSTAPEAEACYSPCSVGPCDVYREPTLVTIYDPVRDRNRDVDGATLSCDTASPLSPGGPNGFGRCEIQWEHIAIYWDPVTGEWRDLYTPSGLECYW